MIFNDRLARSAPAWAAGAHRPPVNLGVTLVCWILVFLQVVFTLSMAWHSDPLDYFEDPVRSLLLIGDSDLDFAAATETLPAWERAVYRLLGYDPATLIGEVDGAYARLSAFMGRDPEWFTREEDLAVRVRRAMLQGELNRSDEWDALLSADIAGVLRAAYGESEAIPAVDPQVFDSLRTPMGEGESSNWALDRLTQRLADGSGDVDRAEEAESRILDRGYGQVVRGRLLEAIYLGTVLSGLGILLWRLPRISGHLALARGVTVAPWSMRYGVAVIVRCLAVTFLAELLVWYAPIPLYPVSSLVLGIPAVFVMHWYLFRPDATTPLHGYGMLQGNVSAPRLAAFALALTAIDQCGGLAIQGVTEWAGLPHFWEEGIEETLLFGPLSSALLLAADGIVWAPLFEELLFRGMLYVTLRTRLRPLPAALLSGALFGVIHLYSIAGFLDVFWTGLVLALGYERCRSLWPCIFAHMFHNFFVFGGAMLFYW